MNPIQDLKHNNRLLKCYFFGAFLVWSIFIAVLCIHSNHENKHVAEKLAVLQGKADFEQAALTHRWPAGHGGVYVPITEHTSPNPYLGHLPERDITTPGDHELTLINPAYMSRQIFELVKAGTSSAQCQGHITSLNPISPENAPDAWEAKALEQFENGVDEVTGISTVSDKLYMRYMKPLIANQACLKCHAEQGRTIGDILGGISISVPMEPLYQASSDKQNAELAGYLLIWSVGSLFIRIAYLHINKQIALEREHHKQLKNAKDKAEAASFSKSMFLVNMSHEIRTPLNAVLGFTDLLIEENDRNVRGEYSQVIRTSSENLVRVIDDILDMSKIEMGKLCVQMQPYSLDQFISETTQPMKQLVEEKRLEFYIEKQDNLPVYFVTDTFRLKQCLINLISNAIKFTSKGSVTLSASTFVEQEKTFIRFAVTDTGIGIPEQKQQEIFEAFTQGDYSATRKYGGTGLGLSITANLVELLGGTIDVQSTPGSGSIFTITLPVIQPETPGEHTETKAPELVC